MNKQVGYLFELFVSYQGEGPWVGKRQLFIRLAGCSRSCAYCDTQKSWKARPAHWTLYPGNEQVLRRANPVRVMDIIQVIRKIRKDNGQFDCIAITGGEPLEQRDFVTGLAVGLRKNFKNLKILLETNGLENIVDNELITAIDYFSLDFKIKSASRIKAKPDITAKILSRLKGKKGCIKVIINEKTRSQELMTLARLVKKRQPKWEIIIQPASGSMRNKQLMYEKSDKIIQAMLPIHSQIRLLPQMHRYFGMK
ncbi:7-carboxy-7-deazaguanine synthase QueE [bacterium]|nr:7-carboxy-7-deazaguanine synthase QueE [bacterium]